MTTHPVVKRFDVTEHTPTRFSPSRVKFLVNQLFLQRREKTFHRCVVPTVPLATHAAHDLLVAKKFSIRVACILAATIRVMQQTPFAIRSAMNALHHGAMTPAREFGRGKLRDALTLFDECGVIVATSRHQHLEALSQRAWTQVFDSRVKQWGPGIRVFITGHAMLEKLLDPYKSMTANALLVRVPQLFYSIESDQGAEVTIELVNDGTRRLDNVEVTAEPPHLWDKKIDPPIVRALDVGEEQKVTLRFDPPSGVSPGKYEVRIRSNSFSDDQPIDGEDKTISVEIRPTVRVLTPALLALALIGVVSGVVYTGVRLSRR